MTTFLRTAASLAIVCATGLDAHAWPPRDVTGGVYQSPQYQGHDITSVLITDPGVPEADRRAPVSGATLAASIPRLVPLQAKVRINGSQQQTAWLTIYLPSVRDPDLQDDGTPWNQFWTKGAWGLYKFAVNASGREHANRDVPVQGISITTVPDHKTRICTAIALDGVWGNKRYESRTSQTLYDTGHWRSSAALGGELTLACDDAAIGKCVRWGYKPWTSAENAQGQQVDLRALHQACARAATADYCGDGQCQTYAGTTIWMRDIHGFTDEPGWTNVAIADPPFEASFDTGGAGCVARLRYATLPALCRAGVGRVCEPPDYESEFGPRKPVCRMQPIFSDLVEASQYGCNTTFDQLITVHSRFGL